MSLPCSRSKRKPNKKPAEAGGKLSSRDPDVGRYVKLCLPPPSDCVPRDTEVQTALFFCQDVF
jgi:hypothetical protein